MIDGVGNNREDDIPFDFTTEHHVSFSYFTWSHSKDEIRYSDGTEMSLDLETPEYQEEQEQLERRD